MKLDLSGLLGENQSETNKQPLPERKTTITNEELYKTTAERELAFHEFCNALDCSTCPVKEDEECRFSWLKLEASMTASEVADILEEHNKWRRGEGEYAKAGARCSITEKELGTAIDRAVDFLRNVNDLI